MKRALTAAIALLALSGCDLLYPEDPRLGVESEDACVARLEAPFVKQFGNEPKGDEPVWLPTFTYDVTKLGLEAIQELSVEGSAETAGRELSTSTNETSTAVDAFMTQSVDEKGAFFLGTDPALYRVRGAAVGFGDAVAAGCARQRANMRLIEIDLDHIETQAEGEPDGQAPSEDIPDKAR